MPFHIHGSQMNGFPLPSSSHLSLLPSSPFFFFFSLPHLCTVPASFPQLLSQAGHNIGGRLCVWIRGWGGRRGGGRGGGGGGDVYVDVMRGGDSWWHTSARYMFTGVFVCVWACMAVSLPVHMCVMCDMPMGQLLATHHGCCSNDAVTTTVWHLWRINIFHLEWSYYLPLVAVKKKTAEKYNDTSCNDCGH